MERREYNGWFNYETWLVKLWIDNDQGEVEMWQEVAKEIKEGDAEYPIIDLADQLKDEFEEKSPCDEAGLYTDLLNSALCEVNWYDIAEKILEEIEGEE